MKHDHFIVQSPATPAQQLLLLFHGVGDNPVSMGQIGSWFAPQFPDALIVSIGGFASDLNNLDASKLTGTIDASGLKEGEHTLALKLDLPDQYSASGTQTATFHIVKK